MAIHADVLFILVRNYLVGRRSALHRTAGRQARSPDRSSEAHLLTCDAGCHDKHDLAHDRNYQVPRSTECQLHKVT